MKALIFTGDTQMYTSLRDAIVRDAGSRGEFPELHHTADYDTLCARMASEPWDLVLVAEPGARGMEVCIGARKMLPQIPLVWFSDDPLFAAQSYRLNCAYFATLPASGQRITNAMARVREQRGMRYAWG